MSPDDVDELLASSKKRLPAAPAWLPHSNRVGELKARLPVEVDGAQGRAEIEITIPSGDDAKIVIVFLMPLCVARLCIGSGHRNKVTGELTNVPHFHRWADNRHLNARTREPLPFVEELPANVTSRDEAFAWFLKQVGVDSPSWLPIVWAGQGELFG